MQDRYPDWKINDEECGTGTLSSMIEESDRDTFTRTDRDTARGIALRLIYGAMTL